MRSKVKVQKEAQNQSINMLYSECILLTFPNIFVQHLIQWYFIKLIPVLSIYSVFKITYIDITNVNTYIFLQR